MTENEAIKDLKDSNKQCLRICESACSNIENNQCNCSDGVIERMLDELLQYREIGTVEECKELASIVNMAERNELAKAIDEWLKYNKIGTVEECREAVEKQKPKKPDYEGDGYDDKGELVYDTWICPNCDKKYEVDYDDYKHCPNCGQAIDENLEGMEDE